MKTLFIAILVTVCLGFTGKAPGDPPIASYRVGAALVSVWENKTEDGRTWKNFKIEKLYKKDDKWESSDHFDKTELLQLRAAIDKAISEQFVVVQE